MGLFDWFKKKKKEPEKPYTRPATGRIIVYSANYRNPIPIGYVNSEDIIEIYDTASVVEFADLSVYSNGEWLTVASYDVSDPNTTIQENACVNNYNPVESSCDCGDKP